MVVLCETDPETPCTVTCCTPACALVVALNVTNWLEPGAMVKGPAGFAVTPWGNPVSETETDWLYPPIAITDSCCCWLVKPIGRNTVG